MILSMLSMDSFAHGRDVGSLIGALILGFAFFLLNGYLELFFAISVPDSDLYEIFGGVVIGFLTATAASS